MYTEGVWYRINLRNVHTPNCAHKCDLFANNVLAWKLESQHYPQDGPGL